MRNEEVYRILSKVYGKLGILDERSENTHEYVQSVSKSKKELRENFISHKDDQEAHGAGAANRSAGQTRSWIAIMFSGAAICLTIYLKI